MSAKKQVQSVMRHAICVQAPGVPDLFWIHAEHRPYCGEGPTADAAWRDALYRLPRHLRATENRKKP